MVDDLDEVMKQRRSLEKALAELQDNYQKRPSATLARMIEQLRAELAFRKERSSSRGIPIACGKGLPARSAVFILRAVNTRAWEAENA